MDNSKRKLDLFNCLSEDLKVEGFTYSKSKGGFIRKTDFGQQWYTFLFYKYSGEEGFTINPVIQVRFDEVENFFHETSYFNKREQKGTSTIGCSVENYLADGEDMFRQEIGEDGDIIEVCTYYYDLYFRIVAPFFKKYTTLESLDKLINSDPEKELSLINFIFRGAKGAIIAHLLGRDNLSELIEIYGIQYARFSSGFYKEDYDKVVDNIHKVSTS